MSFNTDSVDFRRCRRRRRRLCNQGEVFSLPAGEQVELSRVQLANVLKYDPLCSYLKLTRPPARPDLSSAGP